MKQRKELLLSLSSCTERAGLSRFVLAVPTDSQPVQKSLHNHITLQKLDLKTLAAAYHPVNIKDALDHPPSLNPDGAA
jgi:hypothetical protein